MRCYECGNRVADGQEECPTCRAATWALGIGTRPGSDLVPVTPPGDTAVTADSAGQHAVAEPRRHGQVAPTREVLPVSRIAPVARSAMAIILPAGRSVCGRVIIAETSHQENADVDLCRVVTRILWALMLLPVILLLMVPLCLVSRRVSPINFLATLGLFRFMNPAAQNHDQVPVRYYRIREEDTGAEVMVRMKGHFTHGNVGQDDIVTLHGRSRSGTLYAAHGYNHRTESEIRLARSYSWIGLVLTLLVIVVLVIRFYEPTANAAHVVQSLGGVR